MPPRLLLEKVVTQSSAIGNMAPEQSPFLQPFNKFPDSVPESDRKRLAALKGDGSVSEADEERARTAALTTSAAAPTSAGNNPSRPWRT